MHSSDYELFRKSLKPGHCLHDLLPVAKNTLLLRPRGHDFMLPYCVSNLHKQSFIVRSLYNFEWLLLNDAFPYYFFTLLVINSSEFLIVMPKPVICLLQLSMFFLFFFLLLLRLRMRELDHSMPKAFQPICGGIRGRVKSLFLCFLCSFVVYFFHFLTVHSDMHCEHVC